MTHVAKTRPFELWGACSRCGARTRYADLKRERLSGLLVCSVPVGKRSACLDPWPDVLDFNVSPDRSIEPPPEPLPARWMLDDITSAGTYHAVSAGTPAAYAGAPKAAPDDATRLQAFMKTQFQTKGTADFAGYRENLNQNQDRASVVTINAAGYDGTFVPSSSVRTVVPPDGDPQMGEPTTQTPLWGSVTWGKFTWGTDKPTTLPWAAPPWSQVKGI